MKAASFGTIALLLSLIPGCTADQPQEATAFPTAVRMQPHDSPVLDKGQSVTFTVQFTGPSASVVWGSSNQSVARVDEHGIATAAGAGTAWVSVYARDATVIRDSVQITVRDNPTLLNRLN